VDRLAPVIVRRDVEIHRDTVSPYHTRMHFSFGEYQDPTHVGIGALRVLNHCFLPPAAHLSAPAHGHAIRLTYVVAGALVHRDPTLDAGRVDPGGVQRTSLPLRPDALEWNPLPAEALELLELWLAPQRTPNVLAEQRQYHIDERRNRWLQIARPHGRSGTGVAVDSDASVLVAHLEPEATLQHTIAPGSGGYVYVIAGAAGLNAHALRAGDAAMITGEGTVVLEGHQAAEVVLVDTAL
jgi:redox-sensitive bicupin YhaK (pirin superfamily)